MQMHVTFNASSYFLNKIQLTLSSRSYEHQNAFVFCPIPRARPLHCVIPEQVPIIRNRIYDLWSVDFLEIGEQVAGVIIAFLVVF